MLARLINDLEFLIPTTSLTTRESLAVVKRARHGAITVVEANASSLRGLGKIHRHLLLCSLSFWPSGLLNRCLHWSSLHFRFDIRVPVDLDAELYWQIWDDVKQILPNHLWCTLRRARSPIRLYAESCSWTRVPSFSPGLARLQNLPPPGRSDTCKRCPCRNPLAGLRPSWSPRYSRCDCQ